ncbi:MAG: YggS family pyridoxal phosphate-dependent enzyme [Gammaproteobacteria bacterium]|nr:YggS family pyridoxal phosphate-dependent enzyme [Gammaproteobacteria bacterium]
MTLNYQNLDIITKDLKISKDTKLLIVTKNQIVDDIIELNSKGFKFFGENRVQEAKSKFENLPNFNDIELHLIGPLQRNKVKSALKIFNVIQSVDRTTLVDEIAKQINGSSNIKTKEFFIQVNIGDEEQKSGVLKKNLLNLYNYSIEKEINIVGLMCIPPNIADPSESFKEMVELRDEINQNLKLSMGMSNDYKIALNFQTNIIRVGSLIFL